VDAELRLLDPRFRAGGLRVPGSVNALMMGLQVRGGLECLPANLAPRNPGSSHVLDRMMLSECRDGGERLVAECAPEKFGHR
jgi:hypothetical protein